jgi:hypothetical protein
VLTSLNETICDFTHKFCAPVSDEISGKKNTRRIDTRNHVPYRQTSGYSLLHEVEN